MPLEIFASGRDDPCWSPQAEDPPIRKHSTSGRLLCETVHAAGPNDGANFQVKITSRPNGLIGGTSCPRRCSHQTSHRPLDGNVLSSLYCMNDPQPEGYMASHIGRRKFLATLGGAVAWPLAARAQQPGKLPTIGFLVAGTPSSHGQWVAAFVQRLRELGWIEGRTITIEYRWAEGRSERFAEIAAEFVRRKVDVIVTSATEAVVAAKQATSVIPIVIAAAGDPVGTGLVASLARPGGNITGLSIQQTDVAAKRLELLREIVPGLRRLAILGNVSGPAVVLDMREAEAAARTLGMEVITSEIRRGEDIAPAFAALKGRAEALYLPIDPLVNTHRFRINTLTLAARLPTVHTSREWVEVGGLMSYGANVTDLFRRSANYVDKILRGTKPGDIPVEQPSKFDLIINLTTARALDLSVPESFLLRADEVIE